MSVGWVRLVGLSVASRLGARLRAVERHGRQDQQAAQGSAGWTPPHPSLLRRLEAATDRIRRLEQENRELRTAVEQALGERRTSAILGTTKRRDTPGKPRSKLIGPC